MARNIKAMTARTWSKESSGGSARPQSLRRLLRNRGGPQGGEHVVFTQANTSRPVLISPPLCPEEQLLEKCLMNKTSYDLQMGENPPVRKTEPVCIISVVAQDGRKRPVDARARGRQNVLQALKNFLGSRLL